MEYISIFNTPLGPGAVVTTDSGVSRVCLPGDPLVDRLNTATSYKSSSFSDDVAALLKQYFMGKPQPFESVDVDLSGCTLFCSRILTLIRGIAFGEIRTYGQVAALAGLPGGARAIGGAMASNPIPLIIPCHRVVAGFGQLTGFSAPGGITMKKKLLKMEGVEFKGERAIQKINVINR
jgi:methylated-DNA-[protein]-cysteine S-methyltransferase